MLFELKRVYTCSFETRGKALSGSCKKGSCSASYMLRGGGGGVRSCLDNLKGFYRIKIEGEHGEGQCQGSHLIRKPGRV
jgi:hypothetical protein